MLLERATEMLSTLAGCSSPRRVASTAGVCVWLCCVCVVVLCMCVRVCVCKRIGKHASVIQSLKQARSLKLIKYA